MARGSSQVAALPDAPMKRYTRFLYFFSATPLKKAARSSGRSLSWIPTAFKSVSIASPQLQTCRSQKNSPASKPLGYPASASSRRARAGPVGDGGAGQETAAAGGTRTPLDL